MEHTTLLQYIYNTDVHYAVGKGTENTMKLH